MERPKEKDIKDDHLFKELMEFYCSWQEQQINELKAENNEKDVYLLQNHHDIEYNFRCGQGENRCNCEKPKDCGYISMAKATKEMNDIRIIHKNNKPYGIRDKGGFLLFFPHISKYTNQEDRYIKEIKEQFDMADLILKTIKK